MVREPFYFDCGVILESQKTKKKLEIHFQKTPTITGHRSGWDHIIKKNDNDDGNHGLLYFPNIQVQQSSSCERTWPRLDNEMNISTSFICFFYFCVRSEAPSMMFKSVCQLLQPVAMIVKMRAPSLLFFHPPAISSILLAIHRC
jgi:hypothetical protein